MIFYDIGLLKTQTEHNDRKSFLYFIKKGQKLGGQCRKTTSGRRGAAAAFNKTQFGRLHGTSTLHINTIL